MNAHPESSTTMSPAVNDSRELRLEHRYRGEVELADDVDDPGVTVGVSVVRVRSFTGMGGSVDEGWRSRASAGAPRRARRRIAARATYGADDGHDPPHRSLRAPRGRRRLPRPRRSRLAARSSRSTGSTSSPSPSLPSARSVQGEALQIEMSVLRRPARASRRPARRGTGDPATRRVVDALVDRVAAVREGGHDWRELELRRGAAG